MQLIYLNSHDDDFGGKFYHIWIYVDTYKLSFTQYYIYNMRHLMRKLK